MSLKIGTIFSGIGTPELALDTLNVKHETIFACEIDKYARKTYLANNQEPNTFYEDVTKLDGTKYKNQLDVLVGGFPCQAFSIAGKRGGFEDTRGTLFFECARLIKEINPKVFILENVKGLISHDKPKKGIEYNNTFYKKGYPSKFNKEYDGHKKGIGETLHTIENVMQDFGYTIYWDVINTKDYGVPQNRERIYIVGFKDEVDFEFAPKQELKLRLKDMLEDSVAEKYLLKQELVEKYLETGTASRHKGSQAGKVADENDETFWTVNAGSHGYSMGYVKCKQSHTLNIKAPESCKRIYSSDGLSPTITTPSGGHQEPKVALPVREVGRRLDENGKRCDENKDIPIQRRYEIGDKEISNCLSGVQKDSYVAIENGLIEVVNDEVRVKEAVAKGYTLATEGDSINMSVPGSKTRRGRVGREVAQTLDTACNQAVFSKLNLKNPIRLPEKNNVSAMQIGNSSIFGNQTSNKGIAFTLRSSNCNGIIENQQDINYIFRKLTPRECFRLQGFDDSFVFPEKMSDTQLYKQAGNGMSRNVLEMIFTQVLKSYHNYIEKQNG